jgi:hypothetical protein
MFLGHCRRTTRSRTAAIDLVPAKIDLDAKGNGKTNHCARVLSCLGADGRPTLLIADALMGIFQIDGTSGG